MRQLCRLVSEYQLRYLNWNTNWNEFSLKAFMIWCYTHCSAMIEPCTFIQINFGLFNSRWWYSCSPLQRLELESLFPRMLGCKFRLFSYFLKNSKLLNNLHILFSSQIKSQQTTAKELISYTHRNGSLLVDWIDITDNKDESVGASVRPTSIWDANHFHILFDIFHRTGQLH